MKKIFFTAIVLLVTLASSAQHTVWLAIKNTDEKQPLAGATATIHPLNISSLADSNGLVVFSNVPAGRYTVKISYAGMEKAEITIQVPLPDRAPIEVFLEEKEEHEEEVVITATRISRTIANMPTRVEIISGEELTEKGNMRPGEIRMLLSESTGIQVQQTSATSFNAGIRIQGLEGRYTQILRDGYPLYAGFSGGLSIMQIAPLDLRQVEIVKGAASTLYGGGAIAGLINLVSKTPGEERDLSFLANGTSAGGLDVSGFYSERYGNVGLTVFGSRNSNSAFDPAGIGLTAIPKFERYTANPRVFLYGRKTTADLGITYITETRTGGSIDFIKNGGSGFFEKNHTNRIITQAGVIHRVNDHSTLQLKNSYSRFDRVITVPGYAFDALQQSSFSELTWNRKGTRADWVAGVNVLTDDLKEASQASDPKRDYHYNTFGLFVQNVVSIGNYIVMESGLRGDYVKEYGFELLPRISAMFRVTPKLTTRIGGGYGYKTPTIFREEAERIQFQNLLPINIHQSKNERSIGGNWDLNYRTSVGAIGIAVNHLFFYTRLKNPLVFVGAGGGKVQLQNSTGHLDTKGTETNLRLTYGHFKLFVGYTFTDANTHFTNVKEWLPLTAKHRLNNVLMYEVEGILKLGLEGYYFSRQRLSDGAFGKPYWITGFMAEKIWPRFSLYVNFENFTDTRQTKFDTIFTGNIDNPSFREIYAPVEGFVVNGGVKIRF